MLKLYDFYCETCGLEWEDLVEGDNSTCEFCLTETPRLRICSGKLAKFSMADANTKKEILRKRSYEHTRKEIIKKEPERFGKVGIDLARKGQVRSAGGLPKIK